MKRRDLIKKIATEAKRQDVEWTLCGEGANQSIYLLKGEIIPIPRHSELGEQLAVEIFKECQAVLGKGWWRR